MNHISIFIENINTEQQEILIAQLSEMGFDGFEEDDDYLKAFIPSDKYDKSLVTDWLKNFGVNFIEAEVMEENWNAHWESQFQPITIYHPQTSLPFCTIRADFHNINPSKEIDIIINPKMSFGTGHHATTYLMMEQMCVMNVEKKKLMDFGTGTGILAILAEKLHAEYVYAFDYDEWSINNAKENIIRNDCSKIQLEKQSTYIGNSEQYDIVLANINLNIILEHLSEIFRAVKIGGEILFSGILQEDIVGLQSHIEIHGGEVIKTNTRNNWSLMVVKRNK